MIIADENLHYIWAHQIPGGDYLGAYRTLPNGKAELVWRFRYHVDDKTFDSKDTKNWYRLESEDPERLLWYQKELMRIARANFNTPVHEIAREEPGDAGTQRMMDEFTVLPGITTKTVAVH